MPSLTDNQVKQVQDIAELATRQYFDHYLNNVLPRHDKAAREHVHLLIEAHDHNPDAHQGVERKFSRLVWVMLGVGLASGGSAAVVAKLLFGLA